MSGKRKLEKIRISNYEILCIMRSCSPEQKNNFVEKIKKSTPLENLSIKSEVKKLAYPIEEMKTAEYLLLNFKVARGRISEIEEVLKNSLVIRHMTVNLDTEKRIKIKVSDKTPGNKKLKKPRPRAEKPSQGSSNKETAGQLGVSN